ncbi:hypothetical protein [Parasedimentitalea psychrophila]|uniref:Uncharacterized protein n=1 Tax=Parasedimentitalea psychrophila TaxID=2997337 RepID=A0A9Y2L5W9_9RHOB|nr:hypothetical protein [Parasedimentitalea psychrophila]WIY27514.1 hypothetical protein QPJ95_11715 [Parasedimentitalea psychrophila]
MVKQVITQSGVFSTLTKAKAYYKTIRENLGIEEILVEPERSDILDIYRRYCDATNYPAETAVDVMAHWDNRKRPVGNYMQTKALFIVKISGERSVFSIDKALEAIAT